MTLCNICEKPLNAKGHQVQVCKRIGELQSDNALLMDTIEGLEKIIQKQRAELNMRDMPTPTQALTPSTTILRFLRVPCNLSLPCNLRRSRHQTLTPSTTILCN